MLTREVGQILSRSQKQFLFSKTSTSTSTPNTPCQNRYVGMHSHSQRTIHFNCNLLVTKIESSRSNTWKGHDGVISFIIHSLGLSQGRYVTVRRTLQNDWKCFQDGKQYDGDHFETDRPSNNKPLIFMTTRLNILLST